jgi:hypothetical protein
MSQWTHVNGQVRIDALPSALISFDREKEIRKIFGNTCTFEHDEDVWSKCTVPCGSEGSLQYSVQKTGTDNSLSWGIVSIWGDLRDFGPERVGDIVNWFYGIKKKLSTAEDGCHLPLFIRQAILTIQIEYHSTTVLLIDNNNEMMVIHSIPYEKDEQDPQIGTLPFSYLNGETKFIKEETR